MLRFELRDEASELGFGRAFHPPPRGGFTFIIPTLERCAQYATVSGSACRLRSRETEHGADGADHALELLLLGQELFAPRGRERVKARPPVVLRRSPLGAHVPVEEQALEGGVERALADL